MKRTPFAVSLAALLAACSPKPPPAPTILLGAVIDRTGSNSDPSWEEAIVLAQNHANAGLKQANYKGGLQFHIAIGDSANDPATALQQAQAFVQTDGAKALISDTSNNDIALNMTAYDADPGNDLNVPIQCGGCTSGSINNAAAVDPDPVKQAALRNSLKWNSRALMSTKLLSKVLVRQLLQAGTNGDVNGDGQFKISIYGSDDAFGRGASNDVKAFAQQLHPTPAAEVEQIFHPFGANPDTYAWSADIGKLVDNLNASAANAMDGYPDAVVIANYAQQSVAFVLAYKQGNYTPRLFFVHTFRIQSTIQRLGSVAEGLEGVSHVLLDDAASGDVFASEYLKAYGHDPVYRGSTYYDNAMTLMLATVIATATSSNPTQVTGAQIRDALPATSDPAGEVVRTGPDEFARAVGLIVQGKAINYEGASGPMDYDANLNVVDRLARYQAQSGKFADVARFDCVLSADCPPMP